MPGRGKGRKRKIQAVDLNENPPEQEREIPVEPVLLGGDGDHQEPSGRQENQNKSDQ